MKKFVVVCLVISVISFLAQFGWTGYRSSQGDDTQSYGRFHAADSTKVSFNWWSLLSPMQSEAQRISGHDTVKFTHKVIYPYGEKFNLVEPESGFTPEKMAADEITKVINDSISRIKVNHLLDYDETCGSVRQYSNPQMVTIQKPVASLNAFGTASPEAKKYGFKESIQIGHIEKENVLLAQARLNRTSKFLEENGFIIASKNSTEVQFTTKEEVDLALINPTILDSMRYVVVDVMIPIQKLEVTTMTLPIMLPLWLALSALGLSLLRLIGIPNIRGPRVKKPATTKPKARKRNWGWASIFSNIWDIILIFFLLIWRVIRYIYLWFTEKWEDLCWWWKFRTTCQKVLAFVLPYAVLMTGLAMYLWLHCPCW